MAYFVTISGFPMMGFITIFCLLFLSTMSRYLATIQACALDVDISLMAGSDMAHIGEKGANLSGGQRARLALARLYALYVHFC